MKQEGAKNIEGQLRGIPDGGISIIRHSETERDRTLLTEQFQGKTIGKGKIEAFPLFYGVEASYNTFLASEAAFRHEASEQIVEIYYCRSGRIGWNMRHGMSVYLGAGDMTVHSAACCSDSAMMFPLEYSEGLSVSADLSLLERDCPEILKDAGLDLESFRKKFCGAKPVSIPASSELENIFAPLFSAKDKLRLPYLKLKIQELFLYLDNCQIKGKELSQYASQQTEVIKEIHTLLTDHPENRYTIEELSRRYLINTSTLKEVFRRVYGQPIASYMKEYRIHEGMKLLRETDEPISVIAGKMGYETPGKFTNAFKDVLHMLPREYRKMYRIEKQSGGYHPILFFPEKRTGEENIRHRRGIYRY